MVKYSKNSKKHKKFRTTLFFSFVVITLVSTYVLSQLDSKILPPVLASFQQIGKTKINTAINNSLREISEAESIKAEDFYDKTMDEYGNTSSITVNTVAVNDFCSQLSSSISEDLVNMPPEEVEIPLGALFNIEVLSSVGPDVTVSVVPIGSAGVDYKTRFESVGINQVNFQLWLEINASVSVVSPLQQQDITVIKRIVLVDTVYSGQVPQTYLNNVPISKSVD